MEFYDKFVDTFQHLPKVLYGRKWFKYFGLLVDKLGFARSKSLQINCGYVFENCVISVFFFIIRLRFPVSNSIIQTLRSRYDKRVVKLVHELEKLDCKTRKCKRDLEF